MRSAGKKRSVSTREFEPFQGLAALKRKNCNCQAGVSPKCHTLRGIDLRVVILGDITSARRATAGNSRVREWAIVSVQLRASNSCAIGLPTRFSAASDDGLQSVELAVKRLARLVDHRHRAGRRAGNDRTVERAFARSPALTGSGRRRPFPARSPRSRGPATSRRATAVAPARHGSPDRR